MVGFAASFDVDVLDPACLTAAVRHAAVIENAAATMKALLAARLAATERWRSEGYNDPAEQLARMTGSPVGRSRDAIKTGRTLGELPATAGAARAGELSADQAAAITDAASANPAAEKKLLDKARRSSLRELNESCAREKAAADPDPEARERRIHKAHSLREWTDRDGTWHCSINNTTTAGAIAMAAIRKARDLAFDRARREGRREPMDAYAADGFTDICAAYSATTSTPRSDPSPTTTSTGSTGTGSASATGNAAGASSAAAGSSSTASNAGGVIDGDDRSAGGELFPEPAVDDQRGRSAPVPNRGLWRDAKIIVHVSWEALARGWVAGDEVCEIPGLGPVPVSQVQAALDTGDPFVAVVLLCGEDVVNGVHLGRDPTALQRTALTAMNVRCCHCGTLHNLQIHHVDGWAATKRTPLRRLRWVCSHCHDLITHKGWDFATIDGHEHLVPPDHPNHPGQSRAP